MNLVQARLGRRWRFTLGGGQLGGYPDHPRGVHSRGNRGQVATDAGAGEAQAATQLEMRRVGVADDVLAIGGEESVALVLQGAMVVRAVVEPDEDLVAAADGEHPIMATFAQQTAGTLIGQFVAMT